MIGFETKRLIFREYDSKNLQLYVYANSYAEFEMV